MRRNSSPLAALEVGIVVVAALATVLAKDGWLLWPPALIALLVAVGIRQGLKH